MNINLSDETLDHLRFHLDVLVKQYQRTYKTAKRENARVQAMARLAEVRDLQTIFEEVEPTADVTATNQGSVFHFALHQTAAIEFVRDTVATEPWQWLGDRAFAVDHRFAPQVVCALRDGGFNVEVK